MRKIAGCFLLVLLMALVVRGDSVTLKTGQTFTGEIVTETAKEVAIKTAGGVMTFPRESIASVKSNAAVRAEFKRRYAELASKLTSGRLELAKWCSEHGLLQEAQRHYQRVLDYDADNEQAREGLKEVAARGKTLAPVDLELELVDKSHVKGRTQKTFLAIATEYGELHIPLANVIKATFSPKRGEDQVITRDFPVRGDILDTKMRMSTEMGELTLELENVTELTLRHKLSPLFVAENLAGEVENLRKLGLDVMIVYDATDSMETSLVALKRNFAQMAQCVRTQVPQVRMGFIAYRDSRKFNRDEFTYQTKLLSPLTTELDKAYDAFLNEGVADGGDIPEAVLEGLQMAIEKAGWNPDARKVIILVGDAPPHGEEEGLNRVYKLAEEWSAKGFVYTIDTTGYGKLMPEFKEIAKRGGGVSFALPKDDLLAQYLAVCILGPRWSEQVIRLFQETPNLDLNTPMPN